MQYVEQEWDFAKVKAGAEFGLPGGKRCTVLDWHLHIQGTHGPVLLVKYTSDFNDRLLQVQYDGKAITGPQLVLFVPVEETVVRRKVKYAHGLSPDNVGCFYVTYPYDDFIGEFELTVSHVPGEPPRLTGARVV